MTKIYQFQQFGNKNFFSQMLAKIILIMKLSFIFLLLSVNVVFASNTYAQYTFLSLDMTNRQVSEVLDEIERLSEFRFYYNSKLVDTDRKVTVSARDADVYNILNQLFASTDIGYKVVDKDVILLNKNEINSMPGMGVFVTSQAILITGIITEENGESLPGVSIMVKNTQIGITSDANGRFSINVPSRNDILVFSYIGFITQEIEVGNQTQINVKLLESTQQIQEVVVVGYGTQRKETLTGAVASINANEITATKSENLVNNMQGKLPGLLYRPNSGEPGDFDMSLSIRGYGTPVIVIDGVIRQRNGTAELAQLNSEDIESISLLKDASAAIYGMNAANGVIIVTTKKGGESKVRFSYSGMAGTKRYTALGETMSALDHNLISNEMARNQGLQPVYTEEELNKFRNNEPGYTDWDWMGIYVYDFTPPSNTHTISARGGTDKLSFFTSLGFNDDPGMLTTDILKYRRYTLRSNITAALTNNLKMNVMVSGRIDERQATNLGFSSFILYKMLMTNDRSTGPYTESGQFTLISPESRNPEYTYTERGGYRRNRNSTVNTQIDFTYTAPFITGLTVNLLGSYDINTRNNSSLNRAYDMYDYHEDTFLATNGTDSYSNTMSLYNKGYVKLQANYKFNHEGHSLDLMGAIEASQERYDDLSGSRQYRELYTYDILNQGTVATQTNSGSREFRTYAAFIGRLNYDYKGKYLVEAMLRRDGSYRYAPNKRWVLFPSVSLGWRVSEEDFFKNNVSFIDNFKLRASYGVSGRDQGSAFQYISAYTSDTYRNYILSDNVYVVGMRPPGVVNDRLSWVTAKFYNAAVDADFLKSKLSTTIEFFQRFNTGLLATTINEVPNTFGASFPDENINSDMNIGLELTLKYRNRIRDFRYSVGANVTYARTKRMHVERAPFTSQWDRWRNSNEERYTGRVLSYKNDGHYTSFAQLETAPLVGGANGNRMMLPGSFRFVDINGDGRISGEDQLNLLWAGGDGGYTSGATSGDGVTWNRVNPPLQLGFPIEASYKSWDLNILFTGLMLYSLNINPGDVWGYGAFPSTPTIYADRWRPVNPEADRWDPDTKWITGTYAPLRTSTTGTADKNTFDLYRPSGNHLRLKNLEIGYTIPKELTNRIGMDKARFYVNGFNLVTFASKLARAYDPERHEGEWQVGLSYPTMMALNIGVNLTF